MLSLLFWVKDDTGDYDDHKHHRDDDYDDYDDNDDDDEKMYLFLTAIRGCSEEIGVLLCRTQTEDLLMTSSDALPLSHRR